MRTETIAIVVACISLLVSLLQIIVPVALRRARERRAAEWRVRHEYARRQREGVAAFRAARPIRDGEPISTAEPKA